MSPLAVEVGLGQRGYTIHVGSGLRQQLRSVVEQDRADGRPLAVITDGHVAAAQQELLDDVFGGVPRHVVAPGEPSKCFTELARCCEFLAAVPLDRRGRLFAVGGGVIGDLAGFAAACHLRGIGFYQVPTTLLAMVDSSVGGKTGINLQAGKNLVGAFHQPLAVFADVATLATLPQREFAAGMAEVIKHGMLADAALFEQLERDIPLAADSAGLAELVAANCRIKAAVVAADERETAADGGRALLNLGHTFGHAIEAVAGYGDYLHGEAVAIGLVLATRLSVALGQLEPSAIDRVSDLLQRQQLPVALRQPLPIKQLLAAASRDKKASKGTVRYVAMRQIGHAALTAAVDPALLTTLWKSAGAR
jgi:3-dehydroquinate synthase